MELYNLSEDISESNNLAETNPEVIAKIRTIMTIDRIPERNYGPEERRRTVEDFVQLK